RFVVGDEHLGGRAVVKQRVAHGVAKAGVFDLEHLRGAAVCKAAAGGGHCRASFIDGWNGFPARQAVAQNPPCIGTYRPRLESKRWETAPACGSSPSPQITHSRPWSP